MIEDRITLYSNYDNLLSSDFINSIDVVSNHNCNKIDYFKDEKNRGFVSWGEDNRLPYNLIHLVECDEVLSQNMHFNAITAYGSGLRIRDLKNGKVENKEILDFFKYNNKSRFLFNQCSDIQYFFFSISVIILSKDGKKIVSLKHKEACNCRFETCNPKTGEIEHVFYGDFENKSYNIEDFEVLKLLRIEDPLKDLEERMATNTEKCRKFAILTQIPTVGKKYYPCPPWYSIFKSGWYKYKQLIPKRKAELLRSSKIKYIVEISEDYWGNIYVQEGATTLEEKKIVRKKHLEEFRDFVADNPSSVKVLFTFFKNTHGNKESYIDIKILDNKKEGGDFIDDSAEAANMMCYSQGIHPSMIGAFPGKSQGSFSGSQERELFTMKQALQKVFHDTILNIYDLIANFNNWNDVKFDIPITTLTVLSTGKDAEEKTLRG